MLFVIVLLSIAHTVAFVPVYRQVAFPSWGISSSASRPRPISWTSSLSMCARKYNTFVRVKSNFEAKTSMENDKGFSLKEYMRLPVEQYVCIKMPLNADLVREQGDLFTLTVPPEHFPI